MDLETVKKYARQKLEDPLLSEVCEELRAEVLPEVIKVRMEVYQELKYSKLISERYSHKKNYTDEEIYNIVIRTTVPEQELKIIEKNFDPRNYKGHSTEVIPGFDLEEVCGDMRFLPYEESRILMFAHGKGYIGYVSSDSREFGAVPGTQLIRMYSKVAGQEEDLYKVIMVHNHNHTVVAVPSNDDGRIAFRAKLFFKTIGIQLADDCVFSLIDFYSRKQAEEKMPGTKDKVFARHVLPEELVRQIWDENQYAGAIFGGYPRQ